MEARTTNKWGGHKSLQILFVENNREFARTVILTFLAEHSVDVVPGISSAFERLAAGDYDVVLVDYDLDDGKGTEVVRQLRRDGSNTKVVAVSSHQEGNHALVQAGADAICPKTRFNRIAYVLARLVR